MSEIELVFIGSMHNKCDVSAYLAFCESLRIIPDIVTFHTLCSGDRSHVKKCGFCGGGKVR